MNDKSLDTPLDYREKAKFGLRHGDVTLAERSYASLLEIEPDDVEALQYLAGRHLARQEVSRALELLLRARRVQPDNPVTWHQLGVARISAGDVRGAVEALRHCLALAPKLFVARLRLGMMLERLEHHHEALVAYFTAIKMAQAQNRWLGDESTAPGLRDSVKHAMNYVDAGRHRLFDDVLTPLRQRYGSSELGRVEQCLAIYLGEQKAVLPDSRQEPKFLYFPGVPSQPFYPRERFPWQAELEAGMERIRKELLAVLTQEHNLESFLGVSRPGAVPSLLNSTGGHDPAWDAYFFYRHGKRYDKQCDECPQTSALLGALPLVHIRDHAPETLFSVLRPGSHILPHRGVTNTRLVTHLPLIVPPDCALRVGGEVHAWQEGCCVTFDDTFEHEAWNNSDETRVVLILDSWNPDLSEAERAAVSDLVGAIGDFNRACEVPAMTD